MRFWSRDRRGKYGADLIATQVLFLLGTSHASDLLGALDAADAQIRREKLQSSYATLTERLENDLATVFFEDLRRSLDLFSARFALPYLEIPDMRLNASGADHSPALNENLSDRIDAWQNLPFDFDTAARIKFDAEYFETFEGVEDIPAQLNASYRKAVFSCMQYYGRVSLSAENAWPGYGWSLRTENTHGQAWRTIGATGRACLFARLHRGSYILSLKFHSVQNIEAVDRLSISVNGMPVVSGNSGHSEGYFLKHFFVPASCFVADDGEVELGFVTDEIDRRGICITAIDVHST